MIACGEAAEPAGLPSSEPPFDVIIGSDVLNPACRGELFAPRVIARRLSRAAGACALLLSEVRSADTCRAAVRELEANGLRVAAYRVCNGREVFELPLEPPPPVGAHLLLVAAHSV